MRQSGISVFIFRRDFRLHDNSTLIECVKTLPHGDRILPLFIFNPTQIDPRKNTYFCNNQVQFMIEALHDLAQQISEHGGKLFLTQGDDEHVLHVISSHCNVTRICFNSDVTPFARERDKSIRHWCEKKAIEVLSLEDYTMLPIETIKTQQGKAYEVFSPFYRRGLTYTIPLPKQQPMSSIFIRSNFTVPNQVAVSDPHSFYTPNASVVFKGGRQHALGILDDIAKGALKNYAKYRDFPARDSTTKLGAYLKFGCISPREAYKVSKQHMGKASVLVQQLFWREFYYNVAFHFPEVLRGQLGDQPNTPVHGKYEKSSWNVNEQDFTRWKTGRTGFPIVDAAMRCMNETGWMHNRLRMIVGMFLVRDLNIDWRKGERYFAQKLVDYDAINNNQGWCWVLSYRRKFSPFKQTSKYDPKCEFIKKWVHELQSVPEMDILMWWEKSHKYAGLGYPEMMIELPGYRAR